MSSLLNKLASSISSQVSGAQPNGGQGNILSIKKSGFTGGFEVVPYGQPQGQGALYEIKTSKHKSVAVTVSKGNVEVFTARPHSFSSTIDLVVNGQPMSMKRSSMSGTITIQHPQLGELKWKVSQMGGSSAQLIDARGTHIASIKSDYMSLGDKKLELMVPCDPRFLDLVVGTAMTHIFLTKQEEKAVAQAVGGV